MIKRFGIIDRVIAVIIESVILALYLTDHISESAALALAILGLVYISSSVVSNLLPATDLPEPEEHRASVDLQ